MAELTQGAEPMTREEKKKWLMRVTRINEEIRELEEMRKTSMERATAITASYSKAAAGGGADPHKFEPVAMAGEIIDKRIRDLQTAVAETVMVAVPSDSAVMVPSRIDATLALLVDQVTVLRLALAGNTVALTLYD